MSRSAMPRRLRREATGTAPAFDLAYQRDAPGIGPVVLAIPGGPGIAVPVPYRRFRRRAARAGLDVIMVEHRGVGLSRRDLAGQDLPASAITVPQVVDDLLAVLDAEGLDRVLVSGSSYGAYVAAALAVTAPERVAGLVLDSPVLGAEDYRAVREHARAMLWRADAPEAGPAERRTAAKLRTLVDRDGHDEEALGAAALGLYDTGGAALVERYLDQLVVGRAPLTRALFAATVRSSGDAGRVRHLFEPDLVGSISYGELRYDSPRDGRIFDPGVLLGSETAPPFRGERYDLATELAAVHAPAVILSGTRDLTAPRPVAEQIAQVLPEATLIRVPGLGHSALDAHPVVLIALLRALSRGTQRAWAERAGRLLEHGGPSWGRRAEHLGLRALLALDRGLVPWPRTPAGLRPSARRG